MRSTWLVVSVPHLAVDAGWGYLLTVPWTVIRPSSGQWCSEEDSGLEGLSHLRHLRSVTVTCLEEPWVGRGKWRHCKIHSFIYSVVTNGELPVWWWASQGDICLPTEPLVLPRYWRQKGADAAFRVYFKVLHAICRS